MKLHYYQKDLLKKLTLSEIPLKFNQLLLKGLTSEHMNYHLKQLLSIKFIKKTDVGYQLTNKGKDYTDSLDDDIKTEEKQPKTSILARIVRNRNNREEQLLCKRLRHPYYGKVGRMTGKVKFGEKLEDTVKREVYEETGLEANDIMLLQIYRKVRKDENKNTVQDVFFYIFEVKNPKGELITESEYQQNFWINKEDLKKRNDVYEDFKWGSGYKDEKPIFKESYKLSEGY